MKANHALVTGGAGFIGSHIVEELLARNIETTVIDDLSTGSLENLSEYKDNKMLHIIVGDARNVSELLADKEIDVVFHEAAIASVPRSVTEPMKVHDVNVNMTLEIMNFCVHRGIKRFIFASSAAVYGAIEAKAEEDIACKPFSPYGASKLCIEDYLSAYHHTYGLECVALRYFNVYGPRQRLSDYSGVITIFINKLLSRQKPTVHGDGMQIRDFVFVKDIVNANMLAMQSENAIGETFNVATGNTISIKELLETLQKITDTEKIGYDYGPPRAGDVRAGHASIEKIKSRLNYSPKTAMYKGLGSVIDSIKSDVHQPLLKV